MKNLLIAVDATNKTADRIIEEALRLIKDSQAKIWLIHVVDPEPVFVGYDVGPDSVRDNLAHLYHEEHKNLQEKAHALKAKGIEAVALLVQGPVAITIMSKANKIKADIVVVGATDHSMLYRALLGNTISDVINHSNIPILVIPLKD